MKSFVTAIFCCYGLAPWHCLMQLEHSFLVVLLVFYVQQEVGEEAQLLDFFFFGILYKPGWNISLLDSSFQSHVSLFWERVAGDIFFFYLTHISSVQLVDIRCDKSGDSAFPSIKIIRKARSWIHYLASPLSVWNCY